MDGSAGVDYDTAPMGNDTLPRNEVHVHYLLPEGIEDARVFTACEGILLPDERARRDRYLLETSRREYVLTRALVKTVLSQYAPVGPGEWRFVQNRWGRPAVALPEWEHLRFNLSNTRGLIACAVADGRDVGIDVEYEQRAGKTVDIADRFFSPLEAAALRELPEGGKRARFFTYWTLKEAYIKARGMGLALPLDQFSFLLDDTGPIRITFGPEIEDDPSSWQFATLPLSEAHFAALAVRKGAEADLAVVTREVKLSGSVEPAGSHP